MRYNRIDAETLIQLVALEVVTMGLSIGIALVALLDGGM